MTDTALAHRSLVALTPQDMGPVQTELASWCKAKILELSRDLADARANMRQAKKMKWRWVPWQTAARKLANRMIYYSKIKAAVQAGYLVVPNFPAEIIAVRVAKEKPGPQVSEYATSINTAKPGLNLPQGQGRYVDETLPHEDLSFTTEPDIKGQTKFVRRFRTDSYDDVVDFPMTMVKPIVLEATQRAMSLNIFDRIGLVHQDGHTYSRKQRRADPMVIGEILNGGVAWPKDHRVTFFIAWWLDTRML